MPSWRLEFTNVVPSLCIWFELFFRVYVVLISKHGSYQNDGVLVLGTNGRIMVLLPLVLVLENKGVGKYS